ncbi:MAG: HD-GYP domain-containing protein [Firmicutes bacterium]|nr:HD-GYP domain-containing protein [Bacillota bacterium]
MDLRDTHTARHSKNVADHSEIIAREMGLPIDDQKAIYLAGLLHDVGKIGVPRSSLSKPSKLTDEELKEVHKHPILSYELISEIPGFKGIAEIVLYHHERYDGHGYPHGIKGEKIPLGSRILCVADSFDAMVSERVYRHAIPVPEAISELEQCAGTQFDPEVVLAFCSYLRKKALSACLPHMGSYDHEKTNSRGG